MEIFDKLRVKLDEINLRLEGLQKKSEEPNFYQNQSESVKVMKEISWLKPIADKYKLMKKTENQLKEAKALLHDPEMKELAEEEIPELKEKINDLSEELIGLLLTSDEVSTRNAIFEIRAGTGGEEAGLFVGDLFRMYARYAEIKPWKVEIISSTNTDLGGYKEIIFIITGTDIYRDMKYETGGHRVQRVPQTEAQGRVHTSACTVVVLPEVEDVEVDLDMDDVRVDKYCASGKGGQHVNRTESAIRLTHNPTGIVVSCQDERSQHQNMEKALSVLRSKLYELEQKKQDKERAGLRAQSGSGDRSEKIRTYNWPQNRVTDHRLGKNFALDIIVDGNLEKLIDDLKAWDKVQKLASIK